MGLSRFVVGLYVFCRFLVLMQVCGEFVWVHAGFHRFILVYLGLYRAHVIEV